MNAIAAPATAFSSNPSSKPASIEPLRDRIVGRVSSDKIKDFEGTVIVDVNQEITEELANQVQARVSTRAHSFRAHLRIRRGVCALCYGRNLATGRMVNWAKPSAVIAGAVDWRTGHAAHHAHFHIAGTAHPRFMERSTLEARNNGVVKVRGPQARRGRGGTAIAMNRAGLIAIVDEKNREKERYHVVYGARLRVQDGEHVTHGQVLAEWDPFTFSILTETLAP